jgi:predicted  nucleic acid-binding Zn-ribbon protein
MSKRLDRIEAVAHNNVEAITANAQFIRELSQTQLRMMEEFLEYRRDMQEMQAEGREINRSIQEIRVDTLEIQAEVKGLQTENRRILDRLFNEN